MSQTSDEATDEYWLQMEAMYKGSGIDSKTEAINRAVEATDERLEEAGKDHIQPRLVTSPCAECDTPSYDVVVAAGEAFVPIFFEAPVYNAESKQHAVDAMIAEIQDALGDVPVAVRQIKPVEDTDE